MKILFPLIVISLLVMQSLNAQQDSTMYERRPFQFTFLFPPLSTNGAKNARIVNDVSLNLLVGVSGGVEAFEAATFINIDQYYVNGFQIAGFGNTVGGSASGVQVAGFLNICDSIEGVPLAFISVVKQNGYRKFGFTVSEVQYANLTYKMGVTHLYNIYSFGKPFGPGSRWIFGGGLGTEVGLTGNMVLNIEGTVNQELWIGHPASPYFLTTDRLNLYNSVKFLFG